MKADTLPALFRAQAERFGPRVAVRHKKDGFYRDLRWDDYFEQASACAAALVRHGVGAGDRVAILAENRLEWLIADMAILSIGAVNVPLHAPLSAQQIEWQLRDSGACFIFISTLAQHEKIQQIRSALPTLRDIVFDSTAWQGFLQRGRMARAALAAELQRRHDLVTPDSLATIIYTSGTTGNPKGVMLSERNLLSNALAMIAACHFSIDSVLLNWLPFSHIYARTVDIYLADALGATLCLAESADTVIANLAEIQPTNMASVPRLYEKILTAVQDPDPKVLAGRLHAIFGARLDWLSSGGAPLPFAVAQAYHDAGILLLQGYGLTESSPVISFNHKDAYNLASVGRPIPGIEVRIAEDGEVLTRGPHVMMGYWKNPQATAQAIVDGWLHTGDLGRLDDAGYLHITGRKKELLVLSNGKKVVPNFIEGLLLADPCIDQAVVCGEGRKYLTALIVPHWDNLAQAMALASCEPESAARDPKIRAFLEERIEQALAHVADWEKVRKIVVLAEPFSVAQEEMTVSLKLRRRVIAEHYREKVDALYREEK